MMAVAEFETEEVVRSSSGKIIKNVGQRSYVAIYDNEKYDDSNLQDDLNKFMNREWNSEWKENPDLLILPKETWEKIHKMITDNYWILPKEMEDQEREWKEVCGYEVCCDRKN